MTSGSGSRSRAERIRDLMIEQEARDASLFLPTDFILSKSLPAVFGTAVALAAIYALFRFLLRRYFRRLATAANTAAATSTATVTAGTDAYSTTATRVNNTSTTSNAKKKSSDENDDDDKTKLATATTTTTTTATTQQQPCPLMVSYRMTNFVANIVLGCAGVYYELQTLRIQRQRPFEVEEIITGLDHLYLLACMQMGFQLWALPVGIFVISEDVHMLVHHCAVIVASFMSCFLRNGFRYYGSFFYGVMEISSVPLAVMNAFKDNPQWMQRYPAYNVCCRLLFCFSFLWIRVIMLLPRMVKLLRDEFLVLYYYAAKRPGGIYYRLYMIFCWSSTFFLMLLQLFWGFLIVKGLTRMLLRRRRSSSSTTTNTTAAATTKTTAKEKKREQKHNNCINDKINGTTAGTSKKME